MASALLLAATVTVDQWTAGWSRRRVAGSALLAVVGIAAAGVPQSVHPAGWALAAVTIAAALVVAYVSILRFDLTMVPLALGTMTAVSALVRAAERPYPGALIGITAGAALAWVLGWWWFKALRRARAPIGGV
jgi:hypothetical protein